MDLKLVPFRPEFFDSFMTWRFEPSCVRHNPLAMRLPEELHALLTGEGSDLGRLRDFSSFRWFIELDGTIVGHVGVMNINHTMKFAEISYQIAESCAGRGIGTEAIKRLVMRCFDETDLRKLIAHVHVENIGSCRLLEKVGFKREGVLREHFLIQGHPVDEAIYGILRSDLVRSSASPK